MVRAYQLDEDSSSVLHVVINAVYKHNMMYCRRVVRR